jgi:hypothetical protein
MSFTYDAVGLYDRGFGPRLVSVTAPGGEISPSSSLDKKSMGKAPGRLTQAGWTGVDVNNTKFRCLDYNVAKLWRDEWGANVGFVVGDGYLVFDNDQGRVFSEILQRLLREYTKSEPLRRYVLAPKHERDAFLVRVVDFVGDGVTIANRALKFRNGVLATEVQLLASGKQFVIAGTHPGTKSPYAWEHELSFDQIPVISGDNLNGLIQEFVEEVHALGWVLEGPPPPPVSAAVSAPGGGADHKKSYGDDAKIDPARLLEAEALLAEIPNRDVSPGEAPNDIDRWLDIYENWITVAYALVAFLGAALASTPAALAVWREWSDGRAQTGQTSENVWKSVLGQPLKFGPLGFIKLVRSLVPAKGEFPDLDPSDPALQPSKTPIWGMFQSRWAYCASRGFVDMDTGTVVKKEGFSDKHAYLAQALTAELRPGHSRRKRLPTVAELFLSQADRLEVSDITYAPGDPRLGPTNGHPPVFNAWRPTTIVASGVSAAQVQPWLDHVEFVMGSPSERDRFLRWCAFVAQHPKFKPNWCFLIMSLQGIGKDTMVWPVKLAVGDGNWKEELIYQLANSFNEVVETKFLVVGETAQPRAGFVSAHDFQTHLKPLTAKPPDFLWVNKKHQAPYRIPNRLAVMMFSNDESPLLLEKGQRRVHVVNRRDAKPEPIGYYKKLNDWLASGGAELAASYLLGYALADAEQDELIGGVAPETDAKSELEHQSTHPALAQLEELLDDASEGKGVLACLVATQGEIADHVSGKGHKISAQLVGRWLLDMEKRKTGVRRLRADPNKPHQAGLVSDGIKHSGRLWLLGEKAPDGRAWSAMTNVEIIALWKNLPAPPNAKVIKFPDDKEEPG